VKRRPGDQRLPDKNDLPFVQDAVVADIEARKAVGIERYGTPLQAFNGRSSLRDAYEESLDLVMYLKQMQQEAHEILCLTIPSESGRQFPTRVEFKRCLALLAHMSGQEAWDFLKQCSVCQGRGEVAATPGQPGDGPMPCPECQALPRCSRCGRDLHGYRGPLCRYCDGTAE
jgi:hypothetical protein